MIVDSKELTFQSDPNAVGSHRVATLNVAPLDFVNAFGPANAGGDDNKVDREWGFISSEGEEISVYAYKATSTYSPDNPDPEDFWSSTQPYSLSVAGSTEEAGRAFVDYALSKIKGVK